MGTYQQAMSRLGEKLRDSEAWPSDSSKESEQLYLLYNAAIAVLRGIPKSRLTPVVVTDLTVQDVDDDLKEALLPANCFFFRPDAGIRRYFFDSGLHYTRSSIPTRSIGALKNNYMHKGEVLFAEELESQRIVFTNASAVKILHYPKPMLPGDPTADYPLANDNDYELAMAIVSAHVSGETIRDSGQSTFQTFLTQLYGDDINVRNET